MSLTEESGPSQDIRTPKDFVTLFLTGTLISFILKAEFKNRELVDDNVSDKAGEAVAGQEEE